MTYALIIAEKPSYGWPDTMHRVLNMSPSPAGVERMNESAWLVKLDNALLFQARLVTILHDARIPHHVSFLDTKPTFVSIPQENA